MVYYELVRHLAFCFAGEAQRSVGNSDWLQTFRQQQCLVSHRIPLHSALQPVQLLAACNWLYRAEQARKTASWCAAGPRLINGCVVLAASVVRQLCVIAIIVTIFYSIC